MIKGKVKSFSQVMGSAHGSEPTRHQLQIYGLQQQLGILQQKNQKLKQQMAAMQKRLEIVETLVNKLFNHESIYKAVQ